MWLVLSLFSALFQVLRNMMMKHLGHALDDTINVWGRFTFLLPFAGLLVLVKGIPHIHEGFWLVGLLFGVIQTLATLSLSKALKESDISLVTPLWKISLILLVVWGFFGLGETPSLTGVIGVVISMVGVYLLNVKQASISFWAPIVAITKDRGQLYTLAAAMGYAPAVVLIKKMALLSDPAFAVLVGYVFGFALITPYTIYKSAKHFPQVRKFWKSFLGLGAFGTLATLFGTTAYTMTITAYVEAVKQVEILFALLIGYFFFQESATIRAVWLGAMVMLMGLVLLNLGG